jgi:uncharacterized protein
MPLFLLTCLDRANALDLRVEKRPAHLDYIKSVGDAVRVAGPLLDEVDGAMIGSIFILDLADRAAAEAFADGDPFHTEGVFGERTIRPFRQTIGMPLAPAE